VLGKKGKRIKRERKRENRLPPSSIKAIEISLVFPLPPFSPPTPDALQRWKLNAMCVEREIEILDI